MGSSQVTGWILSIRRQNPAKSGETEPNIAGNSKRRCDGRSIEQQPEGSMGSLSFNNPENKKKKKRVIKRLTGRRLEGMVRILIILIASDLHKSSIQRTFRVLLRTYNRHNTERGG